MIDPRLIVRALDDLHTLAQAAAGLEAIEARLTARIESAEDLLEEVNSSAVDALGGLRAVDRRAAEVLAAITRMDERATALLDGVDRIDDVEKQVRRLVSLGEQILEGMHKVDAAVSAAQELTAAAHDLRAAAEPLGAAAEPLQGVAERLGRVAERFPGAGRSRG